MFPIPFSKVCLEGDEVESVLASLRSGYFSGDGPYGRACEAEIAELTGCKRVLLTSSCTAALEMAAFLTDVGPGDEVIVPSFTFTSTANAFVVRGARPVFVDIRPDTLNLDERLLPGAITGRTKAIVPVHYAGIACNMESIQRAAAACGALVIEDAAHGFLGTYRDQHLGTLGDLGCVSFHETKAFACGEGGALFLNRSDLIARAEVLREKGTNRSAFFRGEVDQYSWMDVGSSYLCSDLVAALLLGQVGARRVILGKRRAAFERYDSGLRPLADRELISQISIPQTCRVNYPMFYMLVRDLAERSALLTHLRGRGVQAAFHYLPLHLSPFAIKLGIDCRLPVTEAVSDRIVRLPMFNSITPDEQETVIGAIFDFFRVAR